MAVFEQHWLPVSSELQLFLYETLLYSNHSVARGSLAGDFATSQTSQRTGSLRFSRIKQWRLGRWAAECVTPPLSVLSRWLKWLKKTWFSLVNSQQRESSSFSLVRMTTMNQNRIDSFTWCPISSRNVTQQSPLAARLVRLPFALTVERAEEPHGDYFSRWILREASLNILHA